MGLDRSSYIDEIPSFERLEPDALEIRKEMNMRVAALMDARKGDRVDVGEYTAKMLLRQRVVNEKIIDWADIVHPGTRVLDGCAGPEGSLLAAARRGGDWTGNEIARDTAEHLKSTGAKVLLSSADKFDCDDNSFDALVYIFAINNICATKNTFTEASRVLDSEGGEIVVSDPGLTFWVSDLVLYALCQDPRVPSEVLEVLGSSNRFASGIASYYERFPNVKPREYAEKTLEGLLGTDVEHAIAGLPAIVDFVKKSNNGRLDFRKLRRVFSEVLNGQYWVYVAECAKEAGFKLDKLGVLSASRLKDSMDWSVTDVQNLNWIDLSNSREIASAIYNVRNNKHPLSKEVVKPGSNVAQNVIAPVMKFSRMKKAE